MRIDQSDHGDHAADTGSSRERRGGPEATAGPEEQVAAPIRYRETVEAAYRAVADRAAWAEAIPQLRAEWEEPKQRYPERTRATPRTGADGTWRHILPALHRIEAADPERRIAGLEHMVKGEDRLKDFPEKNDG
jgi:hypothetical protein